MTEQYTVGLTEASKSYHSHQSKQSSLVLCTCFVSRVSPSSSHWSIVFVHKPRYSLFIQGLFRDDGQTKFNLVAVINDRPDQEPAP